MSNKMVFAVVQCAAVCGATVGCGSASMVENVSRQTAPIVIAPAVGGQWSELGVLNASVGTSPGVIVPIHMQLQKNNQVLMWDRSNAQRTDDAVLSTPVAYEWDWTTRTFSAATPSSDAVLWCGGNSTLPNGDVISVGGYGGEQVDSGNQLVRLHTPGQTSPAWRVAPSMSYERFYPTSLTLPGGEVLVAGGTYKLPGDPNISTAGTIEVRDTAGNWRQLLDIASTTANWFKYYPWLHILSDGLIFYSGADYHTYFLSYTNNGAIVAGASRSMIVRDYGTSVMYDEDKVLVTGGGTPTQASGAYVDLTNLSTRATAAWQAAPMNYPRKLHNATILPDGKVLVTGGSSVGGDPGTVAFEEKWQPQQTLGTSANQALDIEVAPFSDGRLDVYMIGLDHAVWHRWQDTSLTWQPTTGPLWQRVGDRFASEIAVSRLPNGSAEVAMVDSGNKTIWHINVPVAGATSGPFQQIGTNAHMAQHIAIAPYVDGRLDVYMIGLDNVIWHSHQNASAKWLPLNTTWQRVGASVACATNGATCVKPMTVSRRPDDSSEVVIIDSNQNMLHDWLGADASDHQFQLIGVTDNKAKNISVAPFGDGRLEVFMIGLDNHVWHDWQIPGGASSSASPGGSWVSGFRSVGGGSVAQTVSAVRLRDDHSDVYLTNFEDLHQIIHSNGDSLGNLRPLGAGSTPSVPAYIASRIIATPYLSSLNGRRLDSRVAVTFINTADKSMSFITQEDGPVYASEIWDPSTNVWTIGAAMQAPRTYHSSTVLLPDGTVLSGGGGHGGQEPEHANYEVYSPPYLFKGIARPVISSAPSTVTIGTQFTVTIPATSTVTSVTLLGLSATTHSHNQGQHFNRLTFSRTNSTTLTVTAPRNKNVCPPGTYMLFLLNNGTPSVAQMVNVQ